MKTKEEVINKCDGDISKMLDMYASEAKIGFITELYYSIEESLINHKNGNLTRDLEEELLCIQLHLQTEKIKILKYIK